MKQGKDLDIIAYLVPDEPIMLCLKCAKGQEDGLEPVFESDRQGGEYCDSCLAAL